jgi:hypothetical protein
VPAVYGVRQDRIDHEVVFVGPVDLARYRIGHAGPDEQGLSKVAGPVNTLRVEAPPQEHRARRDLRRKEREHLALSYGNASMAPQPGKCRNCCRVCTASLSMA